MQARVLVPLGQGVTTRYSCKDLGWVLPIAGYQGIGFTYLSLQVASTDEGFSRGSSDAVYHYHSIYDSQHWQETYADPTFEKHVIVYRLERVC